MRLAVARQLFALFALCLAGVASAGVKERYAQLPFRETPFADIEGIHPLSEEQARTIKHFVLERDALGRVTEVSFRQGEAVVPLNISTNAVTHAPHIRIAYAGDSEIRLFFDAKGNPALANGVFREIYTLDEAGNRTSLVFEDFDGNRTASDWGIFEYRWAVDRRGTVTEQRFDRGGTPAPIRPGFPFYCVKLHYDQRGYLALMENYGPDCEQLTLNELNGAQDKLEYDRLGNMVAWNVYDDWERRSKGNGPGVARGVMEHDETGHTVREYYEDENGRIMANSYGWTDTVATFDEHGNMTSRFNHDASGKRIDNPSLGFSGYTMSYDADGLRRVSMAYYDAEGEPAVHAMRGYHSVRTAYDPAGNRARVTFRSADGGLVNRLDSCVAERRWSYDDRNRVSAVSLFDQDGNPVSHCQDGWHRSIYRYYPDGPVREIVRD